MTDEIIFFLAAVFSAVRLCALAKLCVTDRNKCGAVMLVIFAAVIVGFSIYQFTDL